MVSPLSLPTIMSAAPGSLLLFIALLLSHPPTTHASISIHLPSHPDLPTSTHPGPQILYDSLPALFGLKFAPLIEYEANLHLPSSDPYLCTLSDPVVDDPTTNGDDADFAERGDGRGDDDNGRKLGRSRRMRRAAEEEVMGMTTTRTAIALLVRRGRCTFVTKARNAMILNDRVMAYAAAKAASQRIADGANGADDNAYNDTHSDERDGDGVGGGAGGQHRYGTYQHQQHDVPPQVQFVIVYDNSTTLPNSHRTDGLVPMGTRDNLTDHPITVGMVFVHHRTGLDVLDSMALVSALRKSGDDPYLHDDGSYDDEWDLPVTLDGRIPPDDGRSGGSGGDRGDGGGPTAEDWNDWYDDRHKRDGQSSDRWGGGLSWIPMVSKIFFVVLIVYPISRGLLIWYARGGRVLIVRRPAAAVATTTEAVGGGEGRLDSPSDNDEGASGATAVAVATAGEGGDGDGDGERRDNRRRPRRRRRLERPRRMLLRARIPYRIRIVRPVGFDGGGGIMGPDGDVIVRQGVLTAEQVDALPCFEYNSELHAPEEEEQEEGGVGEGDEEEEMREEGDASTTENGKDGEGGEASCPTPTNCTEENEELPSTPTRTVSMSTSSPQTSPRHVSASMCSICLDDFEEGETVRELPRCRHFFHAECIYPWLTERRGCCPLCKASVLETDDDDDDDREDGRGEDEEGAYTV